MAGPWMLVCITPGKRGEAWGGQEQADLWQDVCWVGVCSTRLEPYACWSSPAQEQI